MSGLVVWLTGLPSSGKSTLARRVRARLAGLPVAVLDGDEVREALCPRPAHDEPARDAFYETLGRLAALLARQGLIVLVPATANLRRYRERARAAAPRFLEVHVRTPAAECAARDAKGLYAAARAGRIHDLPGAGAPYEAPEAPEVVAEGGEDEAAAARVCELASASAIPARPAS